MMRRQHLGWAVIGIAAFGLSGCAGGKSQITSALPQSQVAPTITTGALKEQNKGVVILKIDAVSQDCISAHVTLGQRDGDSFKAAGVLSVAGPRVPNRSNVAEAELPPGNYNIVAYTCQVGNQSATLGRMESGKYRSNFASFTVKPGEIVNLGHLHVAPITVSTVTNNVRVTNRVVHVTVSDWALRDLDGFKEQRPQLYGQMQTRLAVVTKMEPMSEAERRQVCERIKALKAEGKVQDIPPACTAPDGAKAKPAKGVVKA